MSSKKRKRSCPFANAKKAPQGKKAGGKTFQNHSIRTDALAASEKGSCFEQERLLALDEKDV